MRLPLEDTLNRLKKYYSPGTRIELVNTSNDQNGLRPGDKGTVAFVDDVGTIFCKWDKGMLMGANYGKDVLRKITN